MGSSPQMRRPPAPPRRSGHLIVIALLVVALIVVGAILALIFGARMISRNVSIHEQQSPAGNKEVSIKTPVGNINVREGKPADATMVGLPVYPGARQIPNREASRLWVDLPGIETVDVVQAHFETPDSISVVQDYYRRQLNSHITKFSTRGNNGKTVIEIKQGKQEKVVALKGNSGGTEITLLRVLHGAGEVN